MRQPLSAPLFACLLMSACGGRRSGRAAARRAATPARGASTHSGGAPGTGGAGGTGGAATGGTIGDRRPAGTGGAAGRGHGRRRQRCQRWRTVGSAARRSSDRRGGTAGAPAGRRRGLGDRRVRHRRVRHRRLGRVVQLHNATAGQSAGGLGGRVWHERVDDDRRRQRHAPGRDHRLGARLGGRRHRRRRHLRQGRPFGRQDQHRVEQDNRRGCAGPRCTVTWGSAGRRTSSSATSRSSATASETARWTPTTTRRSGARRETTR